MSNGVFQKNNRTKILIVLHVYPALSETFLYTLINNILAIGYEVVVASVSRGQAPHQPKFSDQVLYLPHTRRNIFMQAVLAGLWLFRFLVKFPTRFMPLLHYLSSTTPYIINRIWILYRILPLLLIDADITYFAFGGLAAKYLEYTQINPNHTYCSLRGSEINIDTLLHKKYRDRLRAALPLLDGVHCVCKDIENKARDICGPEQIKSQVIYTAVAPLFLENNIVQESEQVNKNNLIRIISTGRLDWRKGYEHGVMAIGELVGRGYKLRWDIYGSGTHQIAIEWAIRDMGLENIIYIHTGVDQATLCRKLLESDIYFHPAVHEGISNSVIESMTVGLAAVVCDVGGMSEVIQTGENGFLVPPRDWRAMADILERIISDKKLRYEIGKRSIDTILRSFTSDRQSIAFKQFFDTSDKR